MGNIETEGIGLEFHPNGVSGLSAKERMPTLRIRPRKPLSLLEFQDLWEYRDLLWSLAFRDLKLRYRQTALGVLWVVFQPVAGAGIFSIVFGWVAGISGKGHSYFLYSLSGLLVWNTFQSTLAKASMALISNGALVSKVYFPRLLLPLATVLSTLVDLLIGSAVFFLVAPFQGWLPAVSMLWLPVWIGLSVMIAVGAGLIAASTMARFRDVQHVLPMLLPFFMYATPVGYPIDGVPEKLRWLFIYNPMAWVVEGGRDAFLGGNAVSAGWFAYTAIVACSLLIIGFFSFRRMERTLADVL